MPIMIPVSYFVKRMIRFGYLPGLLISSFNVTSEVLFLIYFAILVKKKKRSDNDGLGFSKIKNKKYVLKKGADRFLISL
jgi:hypothetical protein